MSNKNLTLEEVKSFSPKDAFEYFTRACVPTNKETFFEIIREFINVTRVEKRLEFEVLALPYHPNILYFHLCVNPHRDSSTVLGYLCLDENSNYTYFADSDVLCMHNRTRN